MKTKVTVVGGGNVGATVAQGIAAKELADVVVVDIVEGVPQGKTLDLMETAPVEKYDSILSGTNNYDGTENSDVVVITAGLGCLRLVEAACRGAVIGGRQLRGTGVARGTERARGRIELVDGRPGRAAARRQRQDHGNRDQSMEFSAAGCHIFHVRGQGLAGIV
jgi:hypothetical protein